MESLKNIIHQSKLLVKAASLGDNSDVVTALNSGANIHYKGDAPVKVASFNGHLDVVKTLITRGANPNFDPDWYVSFWPDDNNKLRFNREKNPWNFCVQKDSALIMALKGDHPDVAEFLADHTDLVDVVKDHTYFKKDYDLLIRVIQRHQIDPRIIFEQNHSYDDSERIKDQFRLIDVMKKYYDNCELYIPAGILAHYHMHRSNLKQISAHLTDNTESMIHLAYTQPHLHVLKFVMQHFGTLIQLNRRHIHLAIESKRIEFLRFTLELTTDFEMNGEDDDEFDDLIEELMKRPLSFLELLVEKGFSLEKNMESLRLYACLAGSIPIIKYLVDHGLVLNDHSIMNAGTPEMIDFLIGCGLNIRAHPEMIVEHATEGHRELALKYLDNGITHPRLLSTICSWYSFKDLVMKAMNFTYHVREYNEALLHCGYKDLNFARRLLDLGADINYTDGHNTALMTAIRFKGNIGIIGFFIKSGAKIRGSTLRFACRQKRADVVDLLLKNGVKAPRDILIDAYAGGNIDIIAQFSYRNIHVGNNAVFLAVAENGHVELMNYLIERGDFVETYERGHEVAVKHHQHAIQKMLSGVMATMKG